MNENIKEFLKKYYLYIGIGLFAVISVLLTIDVGKGETSEIPVVFENDNQYETYIYIDIRGAVLNPGVYKVDADTRLFQLISLAGGLTMDANELKINQSELLVDEMFVYVPSIFETEVNIDEIEESESPEIDSKVNINTSSKTDLETLPGVGPSTAQSIIDYREQITLFSTTEDIMNVPGIGEATYNEIKNLITT